MTDTSGLQPEPKTRTRTQNPKPERRFEHRKNPRDFSTAHKTPWKYWSQNAWHGIYTAVAHWPGCGFFLSVTVPGRVHNVAYSIFQRLLLATYTAGLASNLVVTRTPPRVILGLSSFQETGIPACVLNRTSHLDFVRQARADARTGAGCDCGMWWVSRGESGGGES